MAVPLGVSGATPVTPPMPSALYLATRRSAYPVAVELSRGKFRRFGRLMLGKVGLGRRDPSSIFNVAQPEIALPTQQAPHLPCLVVVIDIQPRCIRRLAADSTNGTLGLNQCFVFGQADSVLA